MQHKTESLRQKVIHLVLDLRMDIIEQHMKDIQTQMKQAGNDMERIKELMTEYKETQQIRDTLAKKVGNDVLM